MYKNKIKIGIAGLGTVGSGVINPLKNNEKQIQKKADLKYQYNVCPLEIKIKKEIAIQAK